MDDRTMDDKKKRRAKIFNDALDVAKIPEWGRAANIVKATGCSPASAQAWIRGSLPSDSERLIELCDIYNIDLYLWVDGKSRGTTESNSSMLESLLYVKNFEINSDITLTPEQFAHLCGAYLDLDKRANIDEVMSILKTS